MNIRQELEAVIRPGQYVIVELKGEDARQVSGVFVEIRKQFIELHDLENRMVGSMTDIEDINCVMNDQCVVLWPREEA